MKVLTRYLLRAHLAPFFFAFVALSGVILINTLAKQLADLAGKGLPLRIVGEFFLLSLPANVALALPMSVLVAVLYTFSQLAAENEVTALRASGVDLRRLVLPLLIAAALLAVGMVYFNDRVLPASNHRWRMLMADVAQTSPLLVLREQTLNPIQGMDGQPGHYLLASRIEAGSGRLGNVTLYDVSGEERHRTIRADSGTMVLASGGRDLLLTLYSGESWETDFVEPERFQRMRFQQQVIKVPGVQRQLERSVGEEYRSDREMTVAMMEAQIDTLRQEVRRNRQGDRELHAPVNAMQTEVLRERIRSFQVEIHKKYSIAWSSLVFVLIGIPLALRFPRGGIGMVIATSLAIFGVFYVGLIGGESLGNEGYLPPGLAMWGMNLVFGVLGLGGFWRLGRERGTGRG